MTPIRKKKIRRLLRSKPQVEKEGYHLPIRTEEEQFEGLPDDLLNAWGVLRSFFVNLGDQKIHTSHRSIIFSRKTCYAFVRPKKSYIELNFFLPEALKSNLIKKVESVSKTKYVHIFRLNHADQIDLPLTEWIESAYRYSSS